MSIMMLILITRGGLSNRIIEINDAITMIRNNKFRNHLVVIWPLDRACNCKYQRLIEKMTNITIINCSSSICRIVRKLMRTFGCFFHMPKYEDAVVIENYIKTKKVIGIETDQKLTDNTDFDWFTPNMIIIKKVNSIMSFQKSGGEK